MCAIDFVKAQMICSGFQVNSTSLGKNTEKNFVYQSEHRWATTIYLPMR